MVLQVLHHAVRSYLSSSSIYVFQNIVIIYYLVLEMTIEQHDHINHRCMMYVCACILIDNIIYITLVMNMYNVCKCMYVKNNILRTV